MGRWLAATGTAVLLAAAAALAGAGTALAKPAAPVLAFTPSPYDFGQVTTGERAAQRFRLTNSGGKATGKLTVRLSGAAAFTIVRDRCSGTRLRPGRSCGVRVRFAPTSVGSLTATLAAADKKGRVSATVALSGTGTGLGAEPRQIYWVSQDEIWAANLDGTDPRAIVTGQAGLEGIAANSNHLYWIIGFNGTIWEANLDGSSPHTIVTGLGTQAVAGVAVTSSQIYWANVGDASDGAGTIWAANLDGSNPHAIVTGQFAPTGVAADASLIYWASARSGTAGSGTISAANPDGTSPRTIVTGQFAPTGVAVDASHLYWTSTEDSLPANGLISVANLDGTSPRTIVTGQNQSKLSGVASDGTHLYWTSTDDGQIWRANLDGSDPQAIVTGQTSPTWMAVTPPVT